MITIYLITSLLVIILMAFVLKLIPILRNLNELIRKDHKTLYRLVLEAHQYITYDDFILITDYQSKHKILIRWSQVVSIEKAETFYSGIQFTIKTTNGKNYITTDLPETLKNKL